MCTDVHARQSRFGHFRGLAGAAVSVAGYVLQSFVRAYALMAFILLDAPRSAALYQSFYWIPHVLIVAAPALVTLLPKPKRADDKKEQ